jgi:cob(I)alamin adenosyltransferase
MKNKAGLIHVLTGEGNGKTTSAVGICIRAIGAGFKVAFVQFLKSGLSHEILVLKKLKVKVITKTKFCPNQKEHEKWFKKTGNTIFCKDCFVLNQKDKQLVLDAFSKAYDFCKSGKFDLVVLDEIFWPINKGLIKEEDLIKLIEDKAKNCELILTGRGASNKIIEIADYACEVKKIKHPFDKNILSRGGIDY